MIIRRLSKEPSAARAWGVTTQVPPVWHVATLRTVVAMDGVSQHARKNLARADLNEKEIALLELLCAPDVYVEARWDVLARKVRTALRAGETRIDRLGDAAPGECNRAVRDNLTRLEALVLATGRGTDRQDRGRHD